VCDRKAKSSTGSPCSLVRCSSTELAGPCALLYLSVYVSQITRESLLAHIGTDQVVNLFLLLQSGNSNVFFIRKTLQ
jgi:hypothetical protein